jgi:DNA-binding Lrp family transcriptional regulator
LVENSKRVKMMRLLQELLNDSCRSDRELGRALGVSQPTVSRMKKELLEKGLIHGFTVLPNFHKIGYELMAITLVKTNPPLASTKDRQKYHKLVQNWMREQPNVVFCSYCRGLDFNGLIISFHKSYKDFDEFIVNHNRGLGHLLGDVKSILVNIDEDQTIKPLCIKGLTLQ